MFIINKADCLNLLYLFVHGVKISNIIKKIADSFSGKKQGSDEGKENRIIDYVPATCHLDSETLLTKNGDVMQIIKIRGFENNDESFLTENLRDKVRKSLCKHIKSPDLFIYLHTIRERSDISPKGDFEVEFADKLNKLWNLKNNWDKQLVNTLYITIVKRREKVGFMDAYLFLNSKLKKRTKNYFMSASNQLKVICSNIINDLKRFDASKLSIIKKNDGFYSEPISFINYLVNASIEPFKISEHNVGEVISHNADIDYKFNSINITRPNEKRFLAIFSIKEMHKIETHVLDSLLQIGSQFIITEAFHLVSYNTATSQYKKKVDRMVSFGKQEMLSYSGLDEIIDKSEIDSNKALSHCKNYMTITVMSDDYGFFKKKLELVTKAFKEIGLIVIREDFYMASVFWSQIPGNMRFLKRGQYLPLNRIANFSSIHHRKMGSYVGSKWGPPVTIFRALDGNPYYFNFHIGENGNTFFMGSSGSGRTTLCKFFLTQATKLEPKIIYLDIDGTSRKFVEAMKGKYFKYKLGQPAPLRVDAFNLRNFFNDSAKFLHWISNFLFSDHGHRDFYIDLIELIVEKMHEKEDLNSYENLKKLMLASEDELLISAFKSNFDEDIYNSLFSEDNTNALEDAHFVAFDMSELQSKPNLLRAYLSLIVQLIKDSLTGERTIVVIDDGNALADDSFILDHMKEILDAFTSKNALALMTVSYENVHAKNFGKIINSFNHQIFCSYKYLDKKYQKIYNLSNYEFNQIKSYDISKRFFLMKNEKESIVGNVNLAQLKDQLEILK